MKYFVVSDIHSFATELKYSLKCAGFNKKNKNHTLIVVGDIFDRGDETIETYKFLSSIPKKRCILIRGNHETLFRMLLNKSYPDAWDFSNHTVDTFCQIAHRKVSDLHCGDVSWKEITDYVKSSKIWAWLNSDQWINYYELDKYIFCHAFIPVKLKPGKEHFIEMFGIENATGKLFNYNPSWRESTTAEWEEANWADPIDYYRCGLFEEEAKKDKVLVVGHWHTADFYWRLANTKSYLGIIQDIYYSKNLIGIDGGVFRDRITREYVHPQNVLVIDDKDFNTCYNRFGHKLEPIKEVPIIETITLEDNK